jgi:hypoxanthine phosphoribosyltransferase
MTIDKTYITADQLLTQSFELGLQVLDSGFRPDIIVGIWRGGAPVAIAIHELFDMAGSRADHIPIRTGLYTGIGATAPTVQVDGLDYLASRVNETSRLLLVDDVFDSGRSLDAVVRQLQEHCAGREPQWRIATPYYKPANNRTGLVPDYYLVECSQWLVFPHELAGLSDAELRSRKPGLGALRERIASLRSD